MMRDRITSSSSVLKERRKKSFIKVLWYLLAGVLFVIGLAFLSHVEGFLITTISVSGHEILKEEDIEKETKNILHEKRFLIFAGENTWLYSKQQLIESLKKAFPRILNVSVGRNGQELSIVIIERERAYLWCGEHPPKGPEDESLASDCYFLDQSGFIFDVSPKFSSGVYFTFYSPIEGKSPIGSHILNFEFLRDIGLLVDAVEDEGLPVHSLVILPEGQYELLFNLPTVRSLYPKLLFTNEQTIEEIYNKFVSLVDEDPFKSDFLGKPNKLEYIDARFHNRVFYKFSE